MQCFKTICYAFLATPSRQIRTPHSARSTSCDLAAQGSSRCSSGNLIAARQANLAAPPFGRRGICAAGAHLRGARFPMTNLSRFRSHRNLIFPRLDFTFPPLRFARAFCYNFGVQLRGGQTAAMLGVGFPAWLGRRRIASDRVWDASGESLATLLTKRRNTRTLPSVQFRLLRCISLGSPKHLS